MHIEEIVGRMLPSERREQILRELELRGSVTVAEFADRTGVSGMTLRRDLAALEGRGLLRRVHGGAISANQTAARGASSERRTSRPLATIGMVVPSASYYYPEVIRGAKDAVRSLGCRLILAVSGYVATEELRQVDRLLAIGVDGLLVTPSDPLIEGTAIHTRLTEARIPVVILERSIDEGMAAQRLESVRSDHAYGAELAVRHLAELGHRAVALAVQANPTAPSVRSGHSRAIDRLDLDRARSFCCEIERQGDDLTTWHASIEHFLDRMLQAEVRAALVLTDVDAMRLIDAAAERGIGVPQDLAVVAYDDEVASLAQVPLTAVAPAKYDLGHLATTSCFERISEPVGVHGRAFSRTSLLPELKVRKSTMSRQGR